MYMLRSSVIAVMARGSFCMGEIRASLTECEIPITEVDRFYINNDTTKSSWRGTKKVRNESRGRGMLIPSPFNY